MVKIGRLGKREFSRGFYVYTGSALNSLPSRISRHLRESKKKHWHIDHLLDAPGVRILGVAWKSNTGRIECQVSQRIGTRAAESEKSFGCGGCKCYSHLHYFSNLSEAQNILKGLGLHFSNLNETLFARIQQSAR